MVANYFAVSLKAFLGKGWKEDKSDAKLVQN